MTDKRAKEVAEKFVDKINGMPWDSHELEKMIVVALESYAKEKMLEAEMERTTRQAMIMGESVMLGGKLVTNEELYKQPTDYIKEAKAAQREADARIVESFRFDRDKLTTVAIIDLIAKQIRGESGER